MSTGNSRPIHLWIIGIASLVWNAMGAFDYLASRLRLDFYISQFTPEQLEFFYSFPAVFTGFWALGVWGALLGSLALLLVSRWAVGLFAISLLGMVVTSIWSLYFRNGLEVMGPGAATFSAVIFLVAVLLLYYARRMRFRGVLT